MTNRPYSPADFLGKSRCHMSLTSYEYVRSLVSLIIHLDSVNFAVSEYQLSFGVCGLSETNIKNSSAAVCQKLSKLVAGANVTMYVGAIF